jgi:hypothetical protein
MGCDRQAEAGTGVQQAALGQNECTLDGEGKLTMPAREMAPGWCQGPEEETSLCVLQQWGWMADVGTLEPLGAAGGSRSVFAFKHSP